jgi:hypothetical protein
LEESSMRQIPFDDPLGRKTVNDNNPGWFPQRWWRRLRQWFATKEESSSMLDTQWNPSRTVVDAKQPDNDSSVTLRPGDNS